jgi:hypothetical protein
MGNRLAKFENVTASATETDTNYILHQNDIRIQKPILERQLEKQSRRMGGTLNAVSTTQLQGQRVETSNALEFATSDVNNLYQSNTNSVLLNRDLFAKKKSTLTARGDEYSIQIVNVPDDDLFGFLDGFEFNPFTAGIIVPNVFQMGRYGVWTFSEQTLNLVPNSDGQGFEIRKGSDPVIALSKNGTTVSTPPGGDLVLAQTSPTTTANGECVGIRPGIRTRFVEADAENFVIASGATSSVYRNGGLLQVRAGDALGTGTALNPLRTGGDILVSVSNTSGAAPFKNGDIVMKTGLSSNANDNAKKGAFTIRAANGGEVRFELDGFNVIWPTTNGNIGDYLNIVSVDGINQYLGFGS